MPAIKQKSASGYFREITAYGFTVDKGKKMADQLEEFLNEELGEEIDEETTEEVATEEEETPETETVEEEGEAPTAPEDDAKTEDKAPETIAMSAFMGLKRENQELKQQNNALKQPENKEDVDIFEDPEKFKNNVITEAQQIALNSRFETSEMIMQDKHDDYDAKAVKFEQMVEKDPSLYNQLVTKRNPAKFIYDTVVKTEKLSKVDNIDAYESEIAELKAKLAEVEKGNKPVEEVPPSMVDVRSDLAPKVEDQVDSLDAILNG